MTTIPSSRVAVVTIALLMGWSGSLAAQSLWTQITRVYQHTCRQSANRWTVCGLFQINQMTASEGGPQALEGYTYVGHDTGTVGLAMGTIGNVEIGGAGAVRDVRGGQFGVVVSGPGRVSRASALTLVGPSRRGDYDGQVNVDRFDFVTFGNAWSIRPDGPDGNGLVVCDPDNVCRPL